MKKQGIYCIQHKESGKKYYGSSMTILRRFTGHKTMLKYNKHHNIYLQRAFNKYGMASFIFYIVEETNFDSVDELQILEEKYVNNNLKGYNIGSVGGGDNLSNHPDKDEIINRRNETNRKNMKNLNTEQKKEKYGKSLDKNPRWIDGRSKMKKICPICNAHEIGRSAKSCNKCNKIGEKNPFFGKKHTEKTLEKLRKNIPWTANATPEDQAYTMCYEITYPDGIIKQIHGLKAIATEFNVSIANVHATIKRMNDGKILSKSVFNNHMIRKIEK